MLSADGVNRSVAARLLAAANNTAAYAADTGMAATKFYVVRTDSDLDVFVTSLDSEGGLLHVTLNVSGSQGLPADDPRPGNHRQQPRQAHFHSKGRRQARQQPPTGGYQAAPAPRCEGQWRCTLVRLRTMCVLQPSNNM